MYFVYYDDDYPDNGGIGMYSFDSIKEACKFIEERLNSGYTIGTIDSYCLIEGRKLKIEGYKVKTKVRVVK